MPEPVAAAVDPLRDVVEPLAGRLGAGHRATARWTCCSSRRDARRSGPSSSPSRAGKASSNHAIQATRSSTVDHRPPIGASAPSPSGGPSATACRPRRGTAGPSRRGPAASTSCASSPSGPSSSAVDDVLRPLAGDPLDDPADHAVAEVGVLVPGAGRRRRTSARPPRRVELVGVDVEVAVGPRVVGRRARTHRQQVAKRDRRRVRRRAGTRPAIGVVEAGSDAAVAQAQHRRGREALRHRGDAEHRARRGRPPVVERAAAARRAPAARRASPPTRGRGGVGGVVVGEGLQLGSRVVQDIGSGVIGGGHGKRA